MRKKIFYGWWVVGAASINSLFGIGWGLHIFTVLFRYLIDEFGWSRGGIATARVMFAFTLGFVGVGTGKWTDLYGPRFLMVLGSFLIGGAGIVISQLTSIWHLYIIYLIMGVGFAAVGGVPSSTAISNWFKKNRGKAMGVYMMGYGLSGFILPPLAEYLFSRYGFRTGCIFLGTLGWVITIPLAGLILRKRPEDMGLLPDGVESEGEVKVPAKDPQMARSTSAEGTRTMEAIRSTTFWLLAWAFFLAHSSMVGMQVHLVAFLRDMGISSVLAATLYSLGMAVSLLGRLIFGYLLDKFSKKYILTASYTLLGTSIVMLLIVERGMTTILYPFLVVLGLGLGGRLVSEMVLVAEIFGVASYGTIYGYIHLFTIFGSALGPPFAGYIFDLYGNYDLAFVIFIIGFIIAISLILSLRPVVEPMKSERGVR